MRANERMLIDQAVERLEIDVPIYGARVVGGRVELTLYGGRTVTWPEDGASPPAHGFRPKPPASYELFTPPDDVDWPAQIVVALGDGPLHRRSVTQLRQLAHLAGLHPPAQLKSIRKTQLVRELTAYRARHRSASGIPESDAGDSRKLE